MTEQPLLKLALQMYREMSKAADDQKAKFDSRVKKLTYIEFPWLEKACRQIESWEFSSFHLDAEGEGTVFLTIHTDYSRDDDETWEVNVRMLYGDDAELDVLVAERRRLAAEEKAKGEAARAATMERAERETLARLLEKYPITATAAVAQMKE